MPTLPRRLGPDSGAQNALSLPPAPPVSGSVVPGPPPPDLEEVPGPQLPTRDGKQDSNPLVQGSDPLSPGGYIDPDEPSEGVRLMR
jgi:hypothetical protein